MQQTSDSSANDPTMIEKLVARAERLAKNGHLPATRRMAEAAADRHRAKLRELGRT